MENLKVTVFPCQSIGDAVALSKKLTCHPSHSKASKDGSVTSDSGDMAEDGKLSISNCPLVDHSGTHSELVPGCRKNLSLILIFVRFTIVSK